MPARISQSFSAYGLVWLNADIAVAVGPALAGIVLEADPDQIGFHPIINHQMRPCLPPWGYQRQGRIELRDVHFPLLSWWLQQQS